MVPRDTVVQEGVSLKVPCSAGKTVDITRDLIFLPTIFAHY